jgi:hypothetical protein
VIQPGFFVLKKAALKVVIGKERISNWEVIASSVKQFISTPSLTGATSEIK